MLWSRSGRPSLVFGLWFRGALAGIFAHFDRLPRGGNEPTPAVGPVVRFMTGDLPHSTALIQIASKAYELRAAIDWFGSTVADTAGPRDYVAISVERICRVVAELAGILNASLCRVMLCVPPNPRCLQSFLREPHM